MKKIKKGRVKPFDSMLLECKLYCPHRFAGTKARQPPKMNISGWNLKGENKIADPEIKCIVLSLRDCNWNKFVHYKNSLIILNILPVFSTG
jgi:hypothetical protein